MSNIPDEEIWRIAKVWYTRDPRANGDKTKGWWGLNEREKEGYYLNAKAVLIAMRRPPKPFATEASKE